MPTEDSIYRLQNFQVAFNDAPKSGYIVECGVGAGNTLKIITRLAAPKQRIFGFDSFEGLPEDWIMSDEVIVPAGSFKYDPPKIAGVELRKGWYKDTLPIWKREHTGRIALLHIDSDLYSSAVTVLDELNDQIVPGTVIVFDDMFETEQYQNWQEGEHKAFEEWKQTYDRKSYMLCRGVLGQASFRIVQ